eukprot:COSAG02_NODE_5135_length_4599_cov_1.829333_2_plen_100_part_00
MTMIDAQWLNSTMHFPLKTDTFVRCMQAKIGETLKLSCVTPKAGSDIYMLGDNFGGAPTPLKWTTAGGDTTITVPSAMTANLPGPGYAFKITGEPATKC